MIRVLLVDDDAEKVRRVIGCLVESGVDKDHIDECRDAGKAKSLLRSTSYDLLVLDIVLPEHIDEPPAPDGGVRLLNTLEQRDTYHSPDHIVGLSAYPEARLAAMGPFAVKSWSVIHYGVSDNEWYSQLKTKAEQIIWARQSFQNNARHFESHLAVVCALDEPELQAVLAIDWHWEKWREPGDPAIYHKGYYDLKGNRYAVHAAACPRMGMASAAVLSTKMISAFRPRFIANVGVAAAIQGRANLGDVIAPEVTWDYGSGKFSVIDGQPQFLQAPNQHQLDATLRGSLIDLAGDDAALRDIEKCWPADRPDTRLRLLLGPIASGAAVIADEEKAKEISIQHRKLLGIEMETYAIFDAASDCPSPRPTAFSLKGVSDFADSRKDDRYRRYAAYTSAQCLRVLCERHIA